MTSQGLTPKSDQKIEISEDDLQLSEEQLFDKQRRLKAQQDYQRALIIGFIMIGSQLTGGVMSQSVAIFADSAHLGAQVLGIITTLSALRYSDTQSHQQYSYGWQKAHLYGSLISIVSLWIFTAWLVYEATRHFMLDELERPQINKLYMLIFSVLGLFLQLAFVKGFIPDNNREAQESVNNEDAKESLVNNEPTRSEKAFKEAHSRISFGIYASSLFVILSATLIYFNETLWYMDSFATYFFAFVIALTTFPLFKNSLVELTETTPPEINLHELKLAIRAIDNSSIITRVYDVNLWKLGDKNCLQCHVESKLDHMEASRKVTELIIQEPWNIAHSSVQVHLPSDEFKRLGRFDKNQDDLNPPDSAFIVKQDKKRKLASRSVKEEQHEDTLVEKMIKIAEDTEPINDTVLLGTEKLCKETGIKEFAGDHAGLLPISSNDFMVVQKSTVEPKWNRIVQFDMYGILDGKKERSIVSQAEFKNAHKLEYLKFLNLEGLKNDFIFLGYDGGFELRDPRDLQRYVLQSEHFTLKHIREVEFITLQEENEYQVFYMAVLCGWYDDKDECEKYTFHQYKMESKINIFKDKFGLSSKRSTLRVSDETHQDLYSDDLIQKLEVTYGLLHSMSVLDKNKILIQAKATQCWILDPMECLTGGLPQKPKYTINADRIRKFYKLGENILGLHIASLMLWDKKGKLIETSDLETTCEFIRCSVMCKDQDGDANILMVGSRRGMYKVDMSKTNGNLSKDKPKFIVDMNTQCMVLSPCERFIVGGGSKKTIIVDTQNFEQMWRVQQPINNIRDVRMSPEFIYFQTPKDGWSILSMCQGKSIDTPKKFPFVWKNSRFTICDSVFMNGDQAVVGIDRANRKRGPASALCLNVGRGREFDVMTDQEFKHHHHLHSWNIMVHNEVVSWILHGEQNGVVLRRKILDNGRTPVQSTPITVAKFTNFDWITLVLKYDDSQAIIYDRETYVAVDLKDPKKQEVLDFKPGTLIWPGARFAVLQEAEGTLIAEIGSEESQNALNNQNIFPRGDTRWISQDGQKIVIKNLNNFKIYHKENFSTALTSGIPINGSLYGIENNSDGFFFGNDLFICQTNEENQYAVFRIKDGSRMCTFNGNEFKFCFDTVDWPDIPSPYVTGIMDKKTFKMYPPTLNCLIHMDGGSINFFADDITLFEPPAPDNKKQFQVLGLPAPALFHQSLETFANMSYDTKPNLQNVLHKYTILEQDVETQKWVKCENLLTYLFKNEYVNCLKTYLSPKACYFACPVSPMQLMKGSSGKLIVKKFFEKLEEFQRVAIIGNLSQDDIEFITTLPNAFSNAFFKVCTVTSYETYPDAQVCVLNDSPLSQISSLSELDQNKDRREYVQDKMFAEVGGPDSQTVIFQKTLLKLNFAPGSTDSMHFLEALNSIPATNDIHSSKVIDQILKYKFQRVKYVAFFMFMIYCAYLACLLTKAAEDTRWLLPWPFVQLIFEMVQVHAAIQSKGTFCRGFAEYYGSSENWTDNGRIILMGVFIWTDYWHAEVFSVIVLLSIFGLMNFMRYIHTLSVFIELYQASLRDMKVFGAFLLMIYLAFTGAFYFEATLNTMEGDELPTFFQIFQETIFLGFGDFGMTGSFSDEGQAVRFRFTWAIYFYLTVIITLVMMNLLIAVISDTFSRTMAKIDQASNSQMSDVLLELETFLFWNRNTKDEAYCVFAEYVDENQNSDDEDGEREQTQQDFREQTTETLSNMSNQLKRILKEVKQE